MQYERFFAGQRKATNRIAVLFVGLLSFMWAATLIDELFSMGWGWDRRILWLAPTMILFALVVRFCAMAIFRFVERNY